MKKSNRSIVVPTRLAAATRRGTLSDGPAGRGRGALSVATVGLLDVEMAPTCEGDPQWYGSPCPTVKNSLPARFVSRETSDRQHLDLD